MSRARALRGMRRWRRAGLWVFGALVVTVFVAELLSLHGVAWPLYVLLALVAFGLALGVWVTLYAFAERSGGRWYALGQTLLAVVLTPVAYLGVAAVPLLVEHDVRRGHARWRRGTAPALGERLGFVALFLVAAVGCTFFFGPFGPLAALMLTPVVWRVLGFGMRRSS